MAAKAKRSKKPELTHSEQQAVCQLESLREMIAALGAAKHGSPDWEDAEQSIHEDPLSVLVKSDWHEPGKQPERGEGEYEILLCTGGPACRIVGRLSNGQPETARIEHQDWGTPWTSWPLSCDEEEDVLRYARCFYFEE